MRDESSTTRRRTAECPPRIVSFRRTRRSPEVQTRGAPSSGNRLVAARAAARGVHRGRVVLSIDCDAHEQEIRISVDDDGAGFSPEALERGTERLFRDDASRVNSRRGIDGTHFGLGLSIAQEVAAAHNGRLELTNPTDAEGHVSGGRATLVLPLRPRR